ncbi:uncharacterized protein LOC141613378 [Silene latifolia]|uniref:uncharacterized protein LOC141613378 n=1 Tax=Silene latifolia TaxID=37657 RepID=UPI003D7742A8
MGSSVDSFSGPQFTWANKRDSKNLILERLDRGYASQDWLLSYPEAHIQNLDIFLSDHAPILLDLSARSTKPKRPYRVDIWCLQNAEIQYLVSSIWQRFSSTPVASSVTMKLSLIRSGILKWVLLNRHLFMLDWSAISNTLSASSSCIHESTSASVYFRNLSLAEQDVQAQHSYWKQRAKSDFKFNDGLPTAYFFSRAKARQKRLRIISLKDNTGSWTASESDLSLLIMDHFQRLFTSSTPACSFSELQDLAIPKLDSFQQDFLSQPFTANDVEKAFFDMQPNKSPGPDGFPPKFYQLFWHTIKADITSAILGFLNSGHIPPAWNNTHIVLIPKIPNPDCISQFRPISLCNVIYRAASKCIALRLRKITDSIIGQNQNAFLPGRLISDSGFLAHELFSYINQRRRGTRCFGALKLDMNKAFDRVSWPFLFHVLKLYDFPKSFRRLLKSCVRTTTLQVLINGTPSARIFPQCGLRQGDPISPYLFIICMEILSLMVIKAESQRSIEGIKLSRNSPAISHLLYADDALLCFRLSSSSCESLRDILISFGNLSGQMINHQKSYIKFSPNTPDDFKEHVTNILKVPSKHNFGLYLGAPIDLGRKKTSAFQFLLDKISSKIISWGAASFSQASKLLLINSILMASIAHDVNFANLLLTSTQWNKVNIFKIFDSISARNICALELPPEPTDDFIYWKFTEDGLFSSNSAYSFLLHNGTHSPVSPESSVIPPFPWVFLWRLPCQPHIKIFLWKLVHGILPTADVLIRRGMSVNPICSLCHKTCETLSHIFRDCEVTQHIWAASLLGIRSEVSSHIPFPTWFKDFWIYITWFSAGDNSLPLLFLLTLYAIWKHRNNVIFRDRCVCPAEIISDIAILSNQQHVFSSLSKALFQSSCISEATSSVCSSPHFISHCFRFEAVFNKGNSLGSFKTQRRSFSDQQHPTSSYAA